MFGRALRKLILNIINYMLSCWQDKASQNEVWIAEIGQKHQFGVFLETIYQKGVVLKLFIMEVCFYLYCAKGRGTIQRGADKWHWFVVSKTLLNGLLHMQWHNHFWTGYDSVDCFGQHVTSWKGVVACQLEQLFAQIT